MNNYSNYAPVRLAPNGLKVNPYVFTYSGVKYLNGDTFIGNQNTEPSKLGEVPVVNIPKCK